VKSKRSTPRPVGRRRRNPEVDFKGQPRANGTHATTTDPDARLYKKPEGTASRLRRMSHLLMENRNGLVVDVAATLATGKAEHAKRGATVGADKGYDTAEFVAGCRKLAVTPHVARKKTGSAIDGRTTRHVGYQTSLKIWKRIEEAFGWLKTVGGLRKTRQIGQARLAGQALLCFATYNLVRMGSLSGRRNAQHV
jgi:hypothetical protein